MDLLQKRVPRFLVLKPRSNYSDWYMLGFLVPEKLVH